MPTMSQTGENAAHYPMGDLMPNSSFTSRMQASAGISPGST